jgi:hypothetical protein
MSITADLSRSDLLSGPSDRRRTCRGDSPGKPHSIQSLYDVRLEGAVLTRQEAPAILDASRRGRSVRVQRDFYSSGAPIVQEVHPIPGLDGRPVAFLSAETSLIQLERHRSRHVSFRRAVQWVKAMCIRGELSASAGLSPFSEWDGVLLVDSQRVSPAPGRIQQPALPAWLHGGLARAKALVAEHRGHKNGRGGGAEP